MRSDHSSPDSAAAIRALGARVTPARVRVLQLLQASDRPLSHREIAARATDFPLDRVTLYRVLDWCVANGLARRFVDEARVARFSAGGAADHTCHAHFHCDVCGRVYCLERVAPAAPRLPRGFRRPLVEMNIRGRCAQCGKEAR